MPTVSALSLAWLHNEFQDSLSYSKTLSQTKQNKIKWTNQPKTNINNENKNPERKTERPAFHAIWDNWAGPWPWKDSAKTMMPRSRWGRVFFVGWRLGSWITRHVRKNCITVRATLIKCVLDQRFSTYGSWSLLGAVDWPLPRGHISDTLHIRHLHCDPLRQPRYSYKVAAKIMSLS